MAVQHFSVDSFILSAGKHCRLDQKYTSFTQINDWVVFDTKYDQVRLADLLLELPIVKCKKGELEEEALLVNISDQAQRSGELENVESTSEIGSDKNYLGDADIFISKLGMPKGYIFVNTLKGQNVLGSSEFIPYGIKNSNLTKYLKYILLHPKALNAYASLESGKTPSHKRVNPYEFLKIKIPLIPQETREELTSKIDPIEQGIKKIKSRIMPAVEVINNVFIRELGFDVTKFEQAQNERFFEVNLSDINTTLLRSTTVQSNYKAKYLKAFLTKNSFFLKDILKKPIKRGKQPEYTESGVVVIKTLNIQNGKINYDEVQYISEEYLKKNEEKAGIYKNDLLLTSTGMGRGKFALYDDDEVCFADSHVSIIRIDERLVLPHFLNYYCQSFFGLEQLKYIEMQIKGTPEIYEAQLNYFQIPNIHPSAQKKIVDEIKTELDKQEAIRQEILRERSKIDEIIEKAMRQ